MNDIFKDMQEKIGCEYISDLPSYKRKVWHEMKRLNHADYEERQLDEGYLVGAWFTFPIDEEDVKEKIGLNEQYEEYAIHDTDNFPIAIGEYVSIEELNEMYEMIEELPDYIVECLDEFISHYGTLEEVVEHKDDIYYYPDCETMTDVAYYYIDELQALGDIPPSLQNYRSKPYPCTSS